MRNQMVKLLALFSIVSIVTFTTSASAYSVGSFNVGGLDTLRASAHLANSGAQTEIDWVNSILGTSFTKSSLVKNDIPEASQFSPTNENSNIFAAELKGAPEYYFIKTGNVGTNNHFLFTNLDNSNWAVLDLDSSFGAGYDIANIGKLSVLGEVGGTSAAPVPEPCTMTLLGVGMLGFAFFGKRRMNKEA